MKNRRSQNGICPAHHCGREVARATRTTGCNEWHIHRIANQPNEFQVETLASSVRVYRVDQEFSDS
jgi:hypothetical protein